MPLVVCKLSRSSRSKVCREEDDAFLDKGYFASQNLYFYGDKLHAVCSIGGGFQSFDLSPASVHNINYLDDIKMQLSDCVLLGEKGDLSAEVQLSIFDNQQIELSTLMCKNQRDYREQPFVFKKSRKRIEILFSQLCDQFMIRRNYAKSFKGFKKRGCQK